MRIEPGSAGWTTTLVALAACTAIGVAGCDRSAPTEATVATETPPATTPPATRPPAPLATDDAEPRPVPPTSQPSIKRVQFPQSYFFNRLPEGVREMEMQPAPKFSFSRWVGGTERQIEELEQWIGPKGDFQPCLHEKLVIVHYWTTVSNAGLNAIERNNELLERFADEDVVFIAIYPNVEEWGLDLMGPALETYGANYPSAVDAVDRSTEMDWNFHIVPGYVLVDTDGIVRAAGLRGSIVGEAVDELLAEWALIKASRGDDAAAE